MQLGTASSRSNLICNSFCNKIFSVIVHALIKPKGPKILHVFDRIILLVMSCSCSLIFISNLRVSDLGDHSTPNTLDSFEKLSESDSVVSLHISGLFVRNLWSGKPADLRTCVTVFWIWANSLSVEAPVKDRRHKSPLLWSEIPQDPSIRLPVQGDI